MMVRGAEPRQGGAAARWGIAFAGNTLSRGEPLRGESRFREGSRFAEGAVWRGNRSARENRFAGGTASRGNRLPMGIAPRGSAPQSCARRTAVRLQPRVGKSLSGKDRFDINQSSPAALMLKQLHGRPQPLPG